MAKKAPRSPLMELGRKHADNMLDKMRLRSEADRTADAINGMGRGELIYTPEEFNAQVDQLGKLLAALGSETPLNYKPKRPRGRPKGSVSKTVHEAAALFKQIKKEMHMRGHRGLHGLNRKIETLIIEKWAEEGRGVPDERSLRFAVRRAKRKV